MSVQSVTVPDAAGVPLEALLAEAVALQTTMAASKFRLYQGDDFIVGQSTTLAAMIAIEATYSGYPAGGLTIAGFGDPYLDDAGAGFLITAPSKQFNFVSADPPVTNQIGGAFLVDSTNVLRGVFPFDALQNMSADTDAVVCVASIRTANPAGSS